MAPLFFWDTSSPFTSPSYTQTEDYPQEPAGFEVALSPVPCWIHGPNTTRLLPCQVLSSQQPVPQAQPEVRKPRPSCFPQSSTSPQMLCAVIVQAMTMATAPWDTLANCELPLHPGWAFH